MSTKKSIKDALQNPINFVENLPVTMKEEVGEAAMRAGDALRNRFALWIKHESDRKQAVLFNFGEIAFKNIRDQYEMADALFENVVGYIMLLKNNTESFVHSGIAKKAKWYVAYSAAEKGWGPLMYDVAFGMAYPNFVTSDRDNVSESAQKVWNHILNNRPDIERILLVDEYNFDPYNPPVAGTVSFNKIGGEDNAFFAVLDGLRDAYSALELAARGSYSFLVREVQGMKALLELLGYNTSTDIKIEQEQAQAILQKLKAMAIENLKKEGTAHGFRLKAPTSAKNGPALAKLLANGKELERIVKNVSVRTKWPINIDQTGQDFFWKKYRH